MRVAATVLSLLLLPSLGCEPAAAPPDGASPAESGADRTPAEADTAAARAAVADFHRALAEGDSARVLELLHPDALIFEAGRRETVAEYRAGHLAADIAFAAAVEREVLREEVRTFGEGALYLAETRARGTFREREIDSQGVETVVLQPYDGELRIVHVHWSSR